MNIRGRMSRIGHHMIAVIELGRQQRELACEEGPMGVL